MTARAKYRDNSLVIDGVSYRVAPNAQVTLYAAGTTTPLPETIYAGVAGPTAKGNPFVADANGFYEFWLASPKRVKIATTVTIGATSYAGTADYEPVHGDPAELTTTSGRGLLQSDPIVNGAFQIWNDGTSFANAADGQVGPESFFYRYAGTAGRVTMSRSTEIPLGSDQNPQPPWSVKFDVTTADPSIGAGEAAWFEHRMEGPLWATIAGQQFTIGLLIHSPKSGVMCIAAGNAVDRVCVQEITIIAADTWELHYVTFPASPLTGTWTVAEGATGLKLYCCFAAGSGYQTGSVGTWTSDVAAGNSNKLIATANQVNMLDNVNNDIYLAVIGPAVLGNAGASAISRSEPETRLLTMRYYQQSYEDGILPGAPSFNGIEMLQGYNNATTYLSWKVPFTVPMCKVPVLLGSGGGFQFYDHAGTPGVVSSVNSAGSPTGGATPFSIPSFPTKKSFGVYVQTPTFGVYVHWVHKARLA